MKHYENKINLSPFLFPMSLYLPFATLSKPTVGLALGKRDGPKVICLNATEGFDLLEIPVMKVGSVSGGMITPYYCTLNRWQKFLIKKINSEI